MASDPIISWQIERERVEVVTEFLFLGCKITAGGDCSHEIQRHLLLGRKAMRNLDSVLKSRDIADKGSYIQGYAFPSSHVQLWELDSKEGGAPKNWCLQILVMDKTPESSLYTKEIKQVNLKGNQPWILIGKTDAETPVFSSFDANSWSLEKSWCWEKLTAEGKEVIRG